MFIRLKETPLSADAELRRLRLSLNTPVVAIDELLVGPAAACIAVHGAPGSLGLVLALRSIRSGQLAYFAPETAAPLADVDLAMEAAAGFAEAMGFLFDVDTLETGADGSVITRAWREFLAEPEMAETLLPEPEQREREFGSRSESEPSGEHLNLSKFRFYRAPGGAQSTPRGVAVTRTRVRLNEGEARCEINERCS